MEFIYILDIIFPFCNPARREAYGTEPMQVWVAFVIAAAVYLVIFAFKAIGLYTMAKNRGMKKKMWCAFLPFANTYLIGELAGGMRLGKSKVKHLGAIAMAVELLACAVVLMQTIPSAYAFATGMYTITSSQVGEIVYYGWEFSLDFPYAVVRMADVAYIMNYIFMILNTVAQVFLLIAFYRTYAPASYIWMVILGVIVTVANAFLIFAFRGRKPIDYDKFMAARAERYRRMQQSQYGPYGGGPYGGNPYGGNPYGGNPYGGNQGGGTAPGAPADPFGEYPSDRDPFEEYSHGGNSQGQNGGTPQGQSGENKSDTGSKPPEDPFS